MPIEAPRGQKRCAAAGCSELFFPKTKRRRYCSERCYKRQWWRDKNGARGLESRRFDACPHGHDRSPENYFPKGSHRCRLCWNKYMRKYRKRRYHSDPEYRSKVLAETAAYKARRRAS